ncbi:Carbonic anhydrase or acetyltransferase, isoleucine patch superfamily [Proteiniborus ethanoligenes]|uniref:Carbonic anhydrase or acetyltransferase, isoleucine patch superfamily n=1 Tax=Proteiniborus ethanoligenes TaxID=415015 RepID=A0A1H3QRK2_9FIRM|nr:gamma carbonic anhydrase family protein [Proteiniborus ethanoligenes]SDZ16046.1 Carbonic anhydrase or acetyltransferase, isoleucine patch superfamily [Proteiniborus ethanoligenes]
MIIEYQGATPNIHESCFIAESAEVIGNINIGEHTSIWYNCVLRGDENSISIGKFTNIQDGSVIHITEDLNTEIGDYVTVGHKAIVHACKIGNNVLVGMGAIILDGAKIEDNVLIGAGSIVTPGKIIPSGSLVLGSPAKVARSLTSEEIEQLKQSAIDYVRYAEKHKK